MAEAAELFDSGTIVILTRAAERRGVSLNEYIRAAALSQAAIDLTSEEFTNDQLRELAKKYPPPQSWFDEDEELFGVES